MILPTARLYELAYGEYALGAYNVNNMEQVLGLFEGEQRAQSTFFAVHLDHGDEKTCYDAIDSDFYSSVMIDASHESFDDNVAGGTLDISARGVDPTDVGRAIPLARFVAERSKHLRSEGKLASVRSALAAA